MPRTPETGHELDQFSVATNEKMSRNPKPFEGSVRGIILQFNAIGEQSSHIVTAKLARGQTDVVNHQKFNGSPFRTGIMVQ